MELEDKQNEELETQEFSELAEEDLSAVSGGCGTPTITASDKCCECGQPIGDEEYDHFFSPGTSTFRVWHKRCKN